MGVVAFVIAVVVDAIVAIVVSPIGVVIVLVAVPDPNYLGSCAYACCRHGYTLGCMLFVALSPLLLHTK